MIFSLLEVGAGAAVAFVLAIVIGITIHEFSHALAGYLMGDMTARDAGRLTLNPLAHLDPMGSFMLLFAGFGWGKPTPYNPYNLRYQKWGPAIVAVAGPISNLVGAIVSIGLLIAVSSLYSPENLLIVFLSSLFFINIMLMVFNLIPIPPLDGSQILFTVLPPRYDNIKFFLTKNGIFILIGLLIFDNITGIGIFRGIFTFVFNLIGRIL